MSEKNIFSSISSNYFTFTRAERKLADTVLQHKAETQYMSISELADSCGVCDATVSRFCRKLGYGGYNDFKIALAKASVEAKTFAVSPAAEAQQTGVKSVGSRILASHVAVLQHTNERLDAAAFDRAVEILLHAKKVYCYGQGGSLLMAQEAWSLFSTVLPKFYCIQDSHMQIVSASLLTEEDAILYFCYSGATKDALELLPIAKANRTRIVLVTRYTKSPVAGYADAVLRCGADENPLQMGSVEAKISQLFLIDVLFQELCARCEDAAADNRERVAKALAVKHI